MTALTRAYQRNLAALVARLTGAEVRHYINPRNEAAENELVIHNEQFLELGLKPITLSEGLLQEVIEVATRYRDRIDPNIHSDPVRRRTRRHSRSHPAGTLSQASEVSP